MGCFFDYFIAGKLLKKLYYVLKDLKMVIYH